MSDMFKRFDALKESVFLIQSDVPNESCITQAVVEAIAEAEGIDPLELAPPLYDVVDPDALENLFTNSQALGKLIFNYKDYEVSVFSDGFISVESNVG